MVQKSKQQVTRERLEKKTTPPAFDKVMRATRTKKTQIRRKELERWLATTNNTAIAKMRELVRTEFQNLQDEDYEFVTLNNGTTTIIQWKGYNINDILSIVFVPKSKMNSELTSLGRILKVANRYDSEDDIVYIELADSDIYNSCGGEHLEIPDKDAKVREIYRMFAWYQVISKKLHKLLDKVARSLEGNYTYKHRDWIKNIVNKRWIEDKYIIGADMTKYSDTLDRSFIVYVLECLGLPKRLCSLIDKVYGTDIYDSTLVTIWRGSEATFQGQYGDFPMITICNLVIQTFIYEKVHQRCKVGYKAAVGDDTGMVFDNYDPDILHEIILTYASVGVNINDDKTGELINGEGSIDFVKLEVDRFGVMEFLNTKSLNDNNVDAIVRDVFDLMYYDDNQKSEIFDALFGPGTGERMMDLSIINGGTNNRPIERRDLALYVSRSQKMKYLQDYKPDDTAVVLEAMQKYLREEYSDIEPYYLFDTPLRGFLTEQDVQDYSYDPNQLDERVKIRILNMMKFGLNEGTIKNLRSWIGIIPEDARKEYEKMVHNKPYDEKLASIWSEINSYETFAAQRKMKESKRRRQISTMAPVIIGVYDALEEVDVPAGIFYPEYLVESVKEYSRRLKSYKAQKNTELILDKLRGIAKLSTVDAFGYCYHYLDIKTGEHSYTRRRLYGVEYNSKYEPITKDIFDTYLAEALKPLDIGFEDMLVNFNEAEQFSWTYRLSWEYEW